MLIDFNHWQGTQIAEEITAILTERRWLQLIEMLKPEFSKDGNQYCYLYGFLPEHCVVGFGDTPMKAAQDFYNNYTTQKP